VSGRRPKRTGRRRILVTNDDGIYSEGIKLLAESLSAVADVVVVAPDREQSATSHSLTLHRPLRIRKIEESWWAVDGTPTDCVNLGVLHLFKDDKPVLIASGINFGSNLGDDVTYSGTVSATFEGTLLGIPSLAFSQQVGERFSFEAGAGFARRMLEEVFAADELPADLLLNVNFPSGAFTGVEFTKLGRRVYQQTVIEKRDPRGRKYYWIAGTPEWKEEAGTDFAAIDAGRVSITPLHLDLTDYRGLEGFGPLHQRLARLTTAGEPLPAERDGAGEGG
jgi:5'-nucleotidase